MPNNSSRIYLPLTDDGTPTGSEDMTVDGSSTAVPFWIEPQSGQNLLLIRRALIFVRDNGTWTSEKYGSITNGLTTGVKFEIQDGDDNVIKLLTPSPVQNNAGWKAVCYDSTIESVGGGDSFLGARWSFFKDDNRDGLFLGVGEKLVCTIQDDLTDLVNMHVCVRGRVLS